MLSIGFEKLPTSAGNSAKPSGAPLSYAPPALALQLHNLGSGQPSTPTLVTGSAPFDNDWL